jgi:hypothetical protein
VTIKEVEMAIFRSRSGVFMVAVMIVSLMMESLAVARECVDCHAGSFTTRTDVVNQMKGSSHHVQGVKLNGIHCYACHWEATAEGKVDERYHSGNMSKGADVNLVVWAAGKRPTVFSPHSTAILFQPALIGTPRERDEVAKITVHCLSCHNDQNIATRPFAGDTNTPGRYAWDGQSVAARYSQKGTTTWGKYSTAQTNSKMRVIKAFSAHGNAVANQGGWTATAGYDGDMPITRGGAGAKNVECFDCHNSHGTRKTGITSSYHTLDGNRNGGLLKETRAGQGGYRMDYQPSNNLDSASQNPYNSGAGLCFDCHETAQAGVTPWGYKSTFGALQPIMGYKDTLRLGTGSKGSTARFAGRQTRTSIASSHLKKGKFLNYSAHGVIGGLCTPCHDPHGVSPTLGDARSHAVPLLRGTWLTSPYREDAPPATMPTRGAYAGKAGNMAMSWDKGDLKVSGSEGPTPMSYNTDRNTFGEGKHIVENDTQFGGLCLKCHHKESFNGNQNDLVHRAVKGWGANNEHAFPCSKCHQPHNSGLPRLMQTSCLESGPSGLRDSVAAPWFVGKNGGNRVVSQSDKPAVSKKTVKESVVGCHVKRAGKRASGPPGSSDGKWNSVNPW